MDDVVPMDTDSSAGLLPNEFLGGGQDSIQNIFESILDNKIFASDEEDASPEDGGANGGEEPTNGQDHADVLANADGAAAADGEHSSSSLGLDSDFDGTPATPGAGFDSDLDGADDDDDASSSDLPPVHFPIRRLVVGPDAPPLDGSCPMFELLSDELVMAIFGLLPPLDSALFGATCRQAWNIFRNTKGSSGPLNRIKSLCYRTIVRDDEVEDGEYVRISVHHARIVSPDAATRSHFSTIYDADEDHAARDRFGAFGIQHLGDSFEDAWDFVKSNWHVDTGSLPATSNMLRRCLSFFNADIRTCGGLRTPLRVFRAMLSAGHFDSVSSSDLYGKIFGFVGMKLLLSDLSSLMQSRLLGVHSFIESEKALFRTDMEAASGAIMKQKVEANKLKLKGRIRDAETKRQKAIAAANKDYDDSVARAKAKAKRSLRKLSEQEEVDSDRIEAAIKGAKSYQAVAELRRSRWYKTTMKERDELQDLNSAIATSIPADADAAETATPPPKGKPRKGKSKTKTRKRRASAGGRPDSKRTRV